MWHRGLHSAWPAQRLACSAPAQALAVDAVWPHVLLPSTTLVCWHPQATSACAPPAAVSNLQHACMHACMPPAAASFSPAVPFTTLQATDTFIELYSAGSQWQYYGDLSHNQVYVYKPTLVGGSGWQRVAAGSSGWQLLEPQAKLPSKPVCARTLLVH
jgi:hypothetical protein